MERRFKELRKQVEEAQRKFDNFTGVLEELNRQLKEDFGCASLEEAEVAQEQLVQERNEKLKQYKKELKDFERKWDDRPQTS